MTLLAIDLPVPRGHWPGIGRVLDHASGALVGFAISFAVIALFWVAHHGIFRYIMAFDRPLIGLNLLFLGTIAFLPYPTEVLSVASGPHPGATVFYAICAASAGLAEGAVWLYATRAGSGLADPSVARVKLQTTFRIARVPVVFLASIPVALLAPGVAQYFWILIFITGIAINRLVAARPDDHADPRQAR